MTQDGTIRGSVVHVRIQTKATRDALRALVERQFAGSQAAFSRVCGLDPADTSRVLSGSRAATVEIVSRVAAALEESAALKLVHAFLSDLVAAFSPRYHITIEPWAAKHAAKRRRSEPPSPHPGNSRR